MRTRYVIGNWKMQGSLAANAALLSNLNERIEKSGQNSHAPSFPIVAVCPPAIYLAQCASLLQASPIALGSQDVSDQKSGAFTGEISAAMLLEFACEFALVGHSERRVRHFESSAFVAAKAAQALAMGITPVVCVGETLAERQANQTEQIVGAQLQAVLDVLGEQSCKIVLAYEPVWAIGTGLTATPEQAQAVHAYLRAQLKTVGADNVSILYGGSVKPNNAAEIFAMPDIDGGLIGGAALVADDFLSIIAAAS